MLGTEIEHIDGLSTSNTDNMAELEDILKYCQLGRECSKTIMDEYTACVILEDSKEINLVTYADSIEEAVDNLVQIRHVKQIKKIIKKGSGNCWTLNNKGDLSKLRELRDQIENEVLLKSTLHRSRTF